MQGAAHFRCKNVSGDENCEYSEHVRAKLIKAQGHPTTIFGIILLREKFLQFDWLRAVVFQLNLKYLHVKITNLLRVVV